MLDILNAVAGLIVHATPYFRAAQDANIFMLDVEALVNYWASSIIQNME